MSDVIDKAYSDLGDIHYKLCMEHNRCASKLMEQDCSSEARDEVLNAKRIILNAALGKLQETMTLLYEA